MFDDSFVEYRAVRDNKATGFAFKIAVVIAAAMFIFFLNAIPLMLGLNLILLTGSLSVLTIWGIYILLKRQYAEYELEIVNDVVNGAKIMGKTKRAELCEFSLKDCQCIAPVTDPKYIEMTKKAIYKLNFTSYKDYPVSDDIWFIMTGSNNPYMVIFSMKPEMYPVFRRYCPRYTARYQMPKKNETEE